MSKYKTLEEEINLFLQEWTYEDQYSLFSDLIPLFELYNIENEVDWLEKEIGCDRKHAITVRLVRTVYLVSRIAALHSGRLCSINNQFKNLWHRMEKFHSKYEDDLSIETVDTLGKVDK